MFAVKVSLILRDFEEVVTSSGYISHFPPFPDLASKLCWLAHSNLNISSTFVFIGFCKDTSVGPNYESLHSFRPSLPLILAFKIRFTVLKCTAFFFF